MGKFGRNIPAKNQKDTLKFRVPFVGKLECCKLELLPDHCEKKRRLSSISAWSLSDVSQSRVACCFSCVLSCVSS